MKARIRRKARRKDLSKAVYIIMSSHISSHHVLVAARGQPGVCLGSAWGLPGVCLGSTSLGFEPAVAYGLMPMLMCV